MKYYTSSYEQTYELAREFAKSVRAGTLITLDGDLGAGKTAFTSGFVKGLGCDDVVTSPTFTIVNEYEGTIPLFHFDMYRLSGSDDLFEIGWEDYLTRGGICAVEWSEITEDAFPENTININIFIITTNTYDIKVSTKEFDIFNKNKKVCTFYYFRCYI